MTAFDPPTRAWVRSQGAPPKRMARSAMGYPEDHPPTPTRWYPPQPKGETRKAVLAYVEARAHNRFLCNPHDLASGLIREGIWDGAHPLSVSDITGLKLPAQVRKELEADPDLWRETLRQYGELP